MRANRSGTQAIFYAGEHGIEVVGMNISEEMMKTTTEKAKREGLLDRIKFVLGNDCGMSLEATYAT